MAEAQQHVPAMSFIYFHGQIDITQFSLILLQSIPPNCLGLSSSSLSQPHPCGCTLTFLPPPQGSTPHIHTYKKLNCEVHLRIIYNIAILLNFSSNLELCHTYCYITLRQCWGRLCPLLMTDCCILHAILIDRVGLLYPCN